MKLKIAIQGYEGSFHHMAAQAFYDEPVTIIPCATFEGLINSIQNDPQTDCGLMAIENAIAGDILPNLNLLRQSNLKVTGEIWLPVKQNLLAYPGTTMDDIREVSSHPMALLQCQDFLSRQKWKTIASEDTALSAACLRQHKSKHIAAIASTLAATLFELDIIAAGIQDMDDNHTRFLALSRAPLSDDQQMADKASLYFQIPDTKRHLALILNIIALQELQLSKLQNFPVPGDNRKNHFHADLEFQEITQLHKAIALIRPLTHELKIYGVYKKGIK